MSDGRIYFKGTQKKKLHQITCPGKYQSKPGKNYLSPDLIKPPPHRKKIICDLKISNVPG